MVAMMKPPHLSDEELREFAEGQCKWVADRLADGTHTDWTPHVAVITSDHRGKRDVVLNSLLVPFNEDADKQNALINVAAQIFKMGVAPLAACLTSEAWTSRQSGASPPMRAGDAPNRQEAILCATMSFDGRCLQTTAPVVRQDNLIQPITFEPFRGESDGVRLRISILEWFWRGFTFSVVKDPRFAHLVGKKVKV